MKQCLACKLEKPLDAYPWRESLGQHLPVCKGCYRARHKSYRQAYRPAREPRAVQAPGPECPCCKQRAPHVVGKARSGEWLEAWGHRCPHGEPCPGWSPVPSGAERCTQCRPTVHVQQEVIA